VIVAASIVLEAGIEELAGGLEVVEELPVGGFAAGELTPLLIAFCCAWKVVETIGHPFPVPFKF
jgi:hypothetical protein